MLNLLVAYTTYDGHSERIAEHIASTLRENGCAVDACNLARSQPECAIRNYDGVVAGGPLHGGKHHPELVSFAAQNCDVLNERPSAFFSVSLSAAGNDEQQGDATRCLNEFLEETGWKPSRTTIVAGALLYREYGFLKRWMMKRIVGGAGGDTDTSRNYVYTDWAALDRFANELAREWTSHQSVFRDSALT